MRAGLVDLQAQQHATCFREAQRRQREWQELKALHGPSDPSRQEEIDAGDRFEALRIRWQRYTKENALQLAERQSQESRRLFALTHQKQFCISDVADRKAQRTLRDNTAYHHDEVASASESHSFPQWVQCRLAHGYENVSHQGGEGILFYKQ
mmetsp:Transcript_12192/g.22600  ORF Transcript_12192/g.22600 Transcript_12192/m.22600 type:complete len:152 (-) Transcript_12192:861-1316(-)